MSSVAPSQVLQDATIRGPSKLSAAPTQQRHAASAGRGHRRRHASPGIEASHGLPAGVASGVAGRLAPSRRLHNNSFKGMPLRGTP